MCVALCLSKLKHRAAVLVKLGEDVPMVGVGSFLGAAVGHGKHLDCSHTPLIAICYIF